ncbi:MAG: hypothetical protein EOM68_08135 [Spirochaetia bacterium]|nr:hypothetical protein [Spirochaetia bacterium]
MQISTYFVKRPEGWRSLMYAESSVGKSSADNVPSGGALLLYPFRTASIHPFSFPFRSAQDVRNALSLKFRLLLSGEEDVEIVPLFSSRSKGGSEGISLCVWRNEIPEDGTALSLQNNVVWPLPLALASRVNGNGGAVFRDDLYCASALFRNGLPVFIRCRASGSDDGGIEAEVRRLVECAAAFGSDIVPTSIWVGSKSQELLDAARETAQQFPRLLDLNISRAALAASLARERTARMLLRFLGWAAATGFFFSAIQLTLSYHLRSSIETYAHESVALYRSVFGQSERAVDPLSQARGKLLELRGQGRTENTLSRVLSHLGRAWLDGDARRTDYPVLEQLRYTGDGADITGTAEKMEAIQNLRSNADGGGYRATLGDIQQIPGGGLRFTLSLRRDAQ